MCDREQWVIRGEYKCTARARSIKLNHLRMSEMGLCIMLADDYDYTSIKLLTALKSNISVSNSNTGHNKIICTELTRGPDHQAPLLGQWPNVDIERKRSLILSLVVEFPV